MTDPRTAVFVDAYSTGATLAREFKTRGVTVHHVQSSPDVPDFYQRTFTPTDFGECWVHEGDQERTIASVAAVAPDFVIPGAETGVLLADALSERLGAPTNGTVLSNARRDKYEMAETLRRAGVRAAAQTKGADPEALADWARAFGHWPVVVKPLDSAGTDGVTFCATADEVHAAATRILGQRNQLGGTNDEVLVMEYLVGQQYFVNSASSNGVHRISEIWLDRKRAVPGASMVCDREELLDGDGETQAELQDYVRQVLDALGIAHGAAHSEIIVTAAGPVLIECGARTQGTILPEAVVRCTGDSHVTVTADAYLQPTTVDASLSPYQLRAHALCVSLISDRAGTIAGTPGYDEVSQLPSFHALIGELRPGDELAPTVDLFTAPGIVYLVHEDPDLLERDYRTIRSLETNGFYELA
jgi:biotin carboxylase